MYTHSLSNPQVTRSIDKILILAYVWRRRFSIHIYIHIYISKKYRVIFSLLFPSSWNSGTFFREIYFLLDMLSEGFLSRYLGRKGLIYTGSLMKFNVEINGTLLINYHLDTLVHSWNKIIDKNLHCDLPNYSHHWCIFTSKNIIIFMKLSTESQEQGKWMLNDWNWLSMYVMNLSYV